MRGMTLLGLLVILTTVTTLIKLALVISAKDYPNNPDYLIKNLNVKNDLTGPMDATNSISMINISLFTGATCGANFSFGISSTRAIRVVRVLNLFSFS